MLVVLVAEQAAQAAGGSAGLMGAFKERPHVLGRQSGGERGRHRDDRRARRVPALEVQRELERVLRADQEARHRRQHRPRNQALRCGRLSDLQLVKAGLTHANKGPDEIDAAMSEKMGELRARRREARRFALVARQHRDAHRSDRNRRRSDHDFSAVPDPRLSAAQRQAQLSLGISEAMYNTAFGLGIAVTCMIAHLFLHQRAKNIQHDLDATQERVFNLLTIQARPGGY